MAACDALVMRVRIIAVLVGIVIAVCMIRFSGSHLVLVAYTGAAVLGGFVLILARLGKTQSTLSHSTWSATT
jgi:hypothetical protein